jgi:hypothetical protein
MDRVEECPMPQIMSCNELIEAWNDVHDDLLKAQSGNKAAARRARKKLMKIRDLAHQARKDLLQVCSPKPEPKDGASKAAEEKTPSAPAKPKATTSVPSKRVREDPGRSFDMDFEDS